MTVPTRTELHAEVDRQFRERHPEAPEKLEKDDPGHASLVEAWLEIRDTVVNEWTDKVFFEYFPTAGKLDPDDPGDAQLIEYWLDIRNQIRDDATPRYNWADPDAVQEADAGTQAAAPSPPSPPTGLRSTIRSVQVWVNAFIPTQGITPGGSGPYSGADAIMDPAGHYFLTDNRSFDPDIKASCRMQSAFQLQLAELIVFGRSDRRLPGLEPVRRDDPRRRRRKRRVPGHGGHRADDV
jgi:hypothetical protein